MDIEATGKDHKGLQAWVLGEVLLLTGVKHFRSLSPYCTDRSLLLASQNCSQNKGSASTNIPWLPMTSGFMPRQLQCVYSLTWLQVPETATILLVGVITLFPRELGFYCCGQTSHRTSQMKGSFLSAHPCWGFSPWRLALCAWAEKSWWWPLCQMTFSPCGTQEPKRRE